MEIPTPAEFESKLESDRARFSEETVEFINNQADSLQRQMIEQMNKGTLKNKIPIPLAYERDPSGLFKRFNEPDIKEVLRLRFGARGWTLVGHFETAVFHYSLVKFTRYLAFPVQPSPTPSRPPTAGP